MNPWSVNFCRLCAAPVTFYQNWRGRDYWQCDECHALQMDKQHLPERECETALYLTHENDVDDPRYQQFVSPITEAILSQITPDKIGLDFGAGPGPVISKIISEKGYQTKLYDPVFYPDNRVLTQQFDYIICCEVIEHFHQPAIEFARLKSLLSAGAKLFCMTQLFDEDIDFAKWHYKNDITHVFFYHRDSLNFIQQQFAFSTVAINQRLITFTN